MPKEKIRIKIEFIIILISTIAVMFLIFWSVWFGRYHAETGLQQLTTILRNGQPNNSSNKLVFLGDSLTAHEDWNVLFGVNSIFNAGQAGDTTDNVLARLDPVLSAKPQKIFLMIGINDLLRGKDVSYVLTNYNKIINLIKIKYPDVPVYIQSVLPTNNGISKMGIIDSQKVVALNDKLNSLADGQKIFFLNLYPNFCGSDNQMDVRYTNDGVHLNASGYAIWRNLIDLYVK